MSESAARGLGAMTIDRHELVGYVPPVGDGCDNCAATEEDIDALTT